MSRSLRQVKAEDEADLRRLVETARMERKEDKVSSYRVIVASTTNTSTHHHHLHHHARPSPSTRSLSSLSPSSSVEGNTPGVGSLVTSSPSGFAVSQESLLRQMQLHLQAVAEHSAKTDDRLVVVTELLQTEQQYLDNLQMLYEQYAEPLRKFSSLSMEDHLKLFVGVEPVFKQTATLIDKLHSAVEDWDTNLTTIGDVFTNRFWKTYADYYDSYGSARGFLEARLKLDKALEEFCELRQQSGVLSLHSLLSLPSIWRKVQNLHLAIEYNENRELKTFVRRLAVLPLVPIEDVDEAWMLVHGEAPEIPGVTELCDYMVKTWVDDQRPLFHREVWSHFASLEEESVRTNNNLESFHSAFAKSFRSPHPNIFSLVTALKKNRRRLRLPYIDSTSVILHHRNYRHSS
ncbi:hypothetical protein ACOMHN_014550 [Nucella lapillus]